MALCIRCRKRSGKRFCPALKTKICAICCAQERMLELACPESCQYLQDAREQAMEREQTLRLKELADEGKVRHNIEKPVLVGISLMFDIIAQIHREKFRDLKDADIAMAIETVIKNLETEDSGLIYEHHATSARIDEISRHIRQSLDRPVDQEFSREFIRRGDKLKALQLMFEDIEAHARRNEGHFSDPRSYLRYISLMTPWPEEKTGPLVIAP